MTDKQMKDLSERFYKKSCDSVKMEFPKATEEEVHEIVICMCHYIYFDELPD
jgi:hypothetical protein